MEFEWDATKAASNLAKHKITFEDAITVFNDNDYYTVDVSKPEYSEARFIAIGMMLDGRMVAVVYTDRQRRRIISARKARKNEEQEYHSRKISS
jgi:hypothetical protein